MNIGYQIYKDFPRLSQNKIKQFKNVPIANIGDACNRMLCLNHKIQSMNGLSILGQAYTVKVPAGDNLLFYYAIDQAQPGDVIVVDGQGYLDRALCGEIMATYALKRKLGGFVIDGAIRDIEDLQKLEFPVFASGVCPNGPYKNGPGEINVPVCVGGQIIHPGDLIVGNKEGIVVIPRLEIDDVLKKSLLIVQKEEKMMKDIDENQFDLSWVYKKLEETNCEIKENYFNERQSDE